MRLIEYILSYLAAQANGILYWPKRWHVCLAVLSTFWAVCRDSQTKKTKKTPTKSIRNTKDKKPVPAFVVCTSFNGWKSKGTVPCLCRRSWYMAQSSVWCHSVTPSLHEPPRRYLHGGSSRRKYPRRERLETCWFITQKDHFLANWDSRCLQLPS